MVQGADEDLDTLLQEAEVIFGGVLFPEKLLSRAPNLKWVHLSTVGIDLYANMDFWKGNILVTNSSGGVALPIAEHTMMFIYMLAKNGPRIIDNKKNRLWERFVTLEIQGRTMGLIGMGAIGTEIARLAKGAGMMVIATRRSATRREPGTGDISLIYPITELHQMLAESDFVVLAAPLTPETKFMIGQPEFKVMKKTAYIINIARGPLIDEPILIRALKEGWIAGAGLDVFINEPLPVDSELWDLPNVLLSSHMSGSSDRRPYRLVHMFCDNLKRYIEGKPMLNIVNREKSY